MHPKIGASLNQLRHMYSHIIEQIEQNHLSTQSDLQSQIQVLKQQLSAQKSKSANKSGQQVKELTVKNKELKDGLGVQLSENAYLRSELKGLQEKIAKQEKQISHFKQNIED